MGRDSCIWIRLVAGGYENPLGNHWDFSLQSGVAVEDAEGQWQ